MSVKKHCKIGGDNHTASLIVMIFKDPLVAPALHNLL